MAQGTGLGSGRAMTSRGIFIPMGLMQPIFCVVLLSTSRRISPSIRTGLNKSIGTVTNVQSVPAPTGEFPERIVVVAL